MKVDNNFPDVDRVLSKLRQYVNYFEEKKRTNSSSKSECESALKLVESFITAVGKYLDSVCNGPDRMAKVRNSDADTREIQEMISQEDKSRSIYHSDIIMNMLMIDRISARNGLQKVFDYAEEFQDNFFPLIASTVEEKAKMSERARVKRRELGNFGLYIGASVTAGMSKEYFIDDDESREFASCEDDTIKATPTVINKVKSSSKGYKKNMEDILR